MKIACIVTGVPRTFTKCIDSLKFIFGSHHVDYFIVVREDNIDEALIRKIEEMYRPLSITITPKNETAHYRRATKMWHEVYVGKNIVAPICGNYDRFVRARFDTIFYPQFLDLRIPNAGTVVVPDVYSYLGINDMFALSDWIGFRAYGDTYRVVPKAEERVGLSFTPELLAQASLAIQSTQVEVRDILIGLYRPWHDSLSKDVLNEIILKHPRSLLRKYEDDVQDPHQSQSEVDHLRQLFESDALFSLGVRDPIHWHHVEIDGRDQTPFRWFSGQAYLARSIPAECSRFRFKIPHKMNVTNLDHLGITFDGIKAPYQITRDHFGRWIVEGILPTISTDKARWLKMGFLLNYIAQPSVEGSNPHDHRRLTAAITSPEFF